MRRDADNGSSLKSSKLNLKAEAPDQPPTSFKQSSWLSYNGTGITIDRVFSIRKIVSFVASFLEGFPARRPPDFAYPSVWYTAVSLRRWQLARQFSSYPRGRFDVSLEATPSNAVNVKAVASATRGDVHYRLRLMFRGAYIFTAASKEASKRVRTYS